jgi:5-methylcytosine-specific restriction endonuclease McrA
MESTRKKAILAGDVTYFTGRPCVRGHVSERYVSGGCKKCNAVRVNALYHADPAAHRAATLRRKASNPEKFLRGAAENAKRWRENNREAVRAKNRARATKVLVGASPRQVQDWVRAEPKLCLWCGEDCSSGWHVDHVTPLSKGGRHALSNLAISCRGCNLKKHKMLPTLWLVELFSQGNRT